MLRTPFPIMQIGVGVFATNASSQYEFSAFREQALFGIRALLESYPRIDFFALAPNYLELRYIDILDQTVLGGEPYADFLNKGTSFKIALPATFTSNKVAGNASGRLVYEVDLKGFKNSRLIIDVASARLTEKPEDVIRMQTTVRTVNTGVPLLKNKTSFVKRIGDWFDFAHDITSPLFKEIVSESVMKKFKDL